MDLQELQKDPKMMEIMKEIGNIMQMRSKQEQAEKVKNFRILNENAVKYDYHFINANDGLCDAEGYLKKDFTKEGLHMFANAYEVVFNNIKPYI